MREELLEREEEFALARRWRERGDEPSLHRLTRAYARLVVRIAMRFRGFGLPVGDLVQEGNIGLMEAAARFDPARNARFSTYAAWWIMAAIQDYVLRNTALSDASGPDRWASMCSTSATDTCNATARRSRSLSVRSPFAPVA